jgi:hypothetical protein
LWNPIEVCSGKNTILSIRNPHDGAQYNWYADSAIEKIIAQGTSFVTPVIKNDTSYFVELSINGKASKKTKVSIKVLPAPVAPQLGIIDAQPIAYGNSARLKVENPDHLLKYEWYNSESGINLLSEDTLVVTPGLTSETTYYVESVFKRTGCASTSRTKIVVSVSPKNKSGISGKNNRKSR